MKCFSTVSVMVGKARRRKPCDRPVAYLMGTAKVPYCAIHGEAFMAKAPKVEVERRRIERISGETMTMIATVTTYKCDGCGIEDAHPHAWRSFVAVQFGQSVFVNGMQTTSEDYCYSCVSKMRAAVKTVVTP